MVRGRMAAVNRIDQCSYGPPGPCMPMLVLDELNLMCEDVILTYCLVVANTHTASWRGSKEKKAKSAKEDAR